MPAAVLENLNSEPEFGILKWYDKLILVALFPLPSKEMPLKTSTSLY